MKLCKSCETVLPINDFYVLKHTSDGLNWRCKKCQNLYNKEHSRKLALAKIPEILKGEFQHIPYEFVLRFLRKIKATPDECWEWTGSIHPDSGYGRFWISARTSRPAHRLAYEWSGRLIPEELVIDHLCRNRKCVNPRHMEPVTNVENVMRGESIWAINARKTHCLRGHEFTPTNTYLTKRGERHCKECTRLRKRERRAQNKIS